MKSASSTLIRRALLIVSVLGTLIWGGCADRRPVLYLYNWADYLCPDVLAEFEDEYGVRVVVDTFDSNESMLAKLQAGSIGYDIIFPTSYMVGVMRERGMLQELDHEQLPNLEHIDPFYLENLATDPGMSHSVPYMAGSTGIAYRRDILGELDDTWGVYEDPRIQGRATMLNDIREVIGAALIYRGHGINESSEAALAEAGETLASWRGGLARLDSEMYKHGLASGEFLLVQGYSGDILQVMEEVDGIAFMLPREGFALAIDEMVIPVGARSPELAHQFIDFMHRPEIAARNMEFTYFFSPNLASYELVDPEIRENPMVFIPREKWERAHTLEDLGEDLPRVSRLWDRVRSGLN